jgi:hypothetical protein
MATRKSLIVETSTTKEATKKTSHPKAGSKLELAEALYPP